MTATTDAPQPSPSPTAPPAFRRIQPRTIAILAALTVIGLGILGALTADVSRIIGGPSIPIDDADEAAAWVDEYLTASSDYVNDGIAGDGLRIETLRDVLGYWSPETLFNEQAMHECFAQSVTVPARGTIDDLNEGRAEFTTTWTMGPVATMSTFDGWTVPVTLTQFTPGVADAERFLLFYVTPDGILADAEMPVGACGALGFTDTGRNQFAQFERGMGRHAD